VTTVTVADITYTPQSLFLSLVVSSSQPPPDASRISSRLLGEVQRRICDVPRKHVDTAFVVSGIKPAGILSGRSISGESMRTGAEYRNARHDGRRVWVLDDSKLANLDHLWFTLAEHS